MSAVGMDWLKEYEEVGAFLRECFIGVLHSECARFEDYMTANRWDTCCAEGIHSDDGMRVVDMFLEFVEEGRVTDDDGKELLA